MERNQQMSSQARQRMAAMLPEMLGAVRWRRRRRYLARGTVLAAAAVLLLVYWPSGASFLPSAPVPIGPQAGASASPVCQIVHDVPGVVDRYRATSSQHAEWYVGDEELQEFLRAADRPSGIVRIYGKVMVTEAALDPFPQLDQVAQAGDE